VPHVVLETATPLFEIVERVEPFAEKERETVWRVREVFLNPAGTHGLVECIVVTGGRPRRFFVQLAQREQDAAIVVRPYAVPKVDPLPSVKRMVALVAEALHDAHPDVVIARSTIETFLSDRWTFTADPEPGEWDPTLPESGLPAPLEWTAVFGDDHPVEIEIGSGKGTFLVEAAEAHPGTNYLSIEVAAEYARYVADRVRRRDLRNVRVVRADAGRFLERHAPPESVRVAHLYFPDPWPKKRHHKRRLVQPAFARDVARALAPGGELRFVTDHAEYFEAATDVLDAEPGLERVEVPGEAMEDLTNYERKYRAEGRSIHRARYRRA